LIKAILLVPTRDNDGRAFPERLWRDLERRLAGAFGGFSRRAGVAGAWESGGRLYRDRNREYTIVLSTWRRIAQLLEIADWTCVQFRQEAVYLEIAGLPEVLERPRDC
jgi:hypothetical protein